MCLADKALAISLRETITRRLPYARRIAQNRPLILIYRQHCRTGEHISTFLCPARRVILDSLSSPTQNMSLAEWLGSYVIATYFDKNGSRTETRNRKPIPSHESPISVLPRPIPGASKLQHVGPSFWSDNQIISPGDHHNPTIIQNKWSSSQISHFWLIRQRWTMIDMEKL